MRLSIEATLDYWVPEPADILLAIEVLPVGDQHLIEDLLTVRGSDPLSPITDEESLGRRTWLKANGSLAIHYRAVVDVVRSPIDWTALSPSPRHELPSSALPYLFPSRYCDSDRFEAFVHREFASFEGGAKIGAMADWIFSHVDYCAGSSDGTTSASDSFIKRQGVCRDFAHMLIAFARAAGIPARIVSAYAWQLDPPDFHAVAEVWLSNGWHLIDATRLAPIENLARIATGRDATDISFMTIFGAAEMNTQTVSVSRAADQSAADLSPDAP